MLTPDQINIFYALGVDAYNMASELAEVHGREVTCAWDVMDPDNLRDTGERAAMTDEECDVLVLSVDAAPGAPAFVDARDFTAFVAICRNIVEAGFQAKQREDKAWLARVAPTVKTKSHWATWPDAARAKHDQAMRLARIAAGPDATDAEVQDRYERFVKVCGS